MSTEDAEEHLALGRCVYAFHTYETYALQDVERPSRMLQRLPLAHQRLLAAGTLQRLRTGREAVASNQQFLRAMLGEFSSGSQEADSIAEAEHLRAAAADYAQTEQAQHCSGDTISKVRYVLKNLLRDWAAEGASERAQSYGRIVAAVTELFPDQETRGDRRVLVPGAGLGRLCVDLAAEGFQAQGNEFSFYCLLCSSFLLNGCHTSGAWSIFPWATNTINQLSAAHTFARVAIPDACAGEIVRPGLLSMCAGDFTEVYRNPEMAASFDCVATCYFIDTAHNVLEYIETIHHVLKPGGVWVNFGPLLWHFADDTDDDLSVELTLEEVKAAAVALGFEFTSEQDQIPSNYNVQEASMSRATAYMCAFWTAQKVSQPARSQPAQSVKENE